VSFKNLFFTYSNNNLTEIQFYNGENVTIEYTNYFKATTFLQDKSFGKKLRCLLLTQGYVISSSQSDLLLNLNTSNQISIDEVNNSQYEVADNGYFNKKPPLGNLVELLETPIRLLWSFYLNNHNNLYL